ncbi:MAG: hypothetical protein JXA54_08765 [Candidatus Heimdallarchaeota archaeon]|nr:hypothetical protein [Candidatus Heimdallarchaeota archaeon]
MKTIALYWGYIIGEEHLTEEQFASIDFGNPNIDGEFITFDPLASSFFQGKYYSLHEKKFSFPHRKLPAMRSETMIIYDETLIKIIDPPVDLNTPAGIFLCIFVGSTGYIKRAIDFLAKRINLRFSPCDFDLEQFYNKLSKTRLQIIPKSITISDLEIDKSLKGNLEVFFSRDDIFRDSLKLYKPKNCQIKLTLKEVNLQIELTISIEGTIKFESDIVNLNLLETLYEVASRSVFTGSI